jgi:protease-4
MAVLSLFMGGVTGENIYSSVSSGDTVAVIPLQGVIGYGQSDSSGTQIVTPDSIRGAISQAESDSSVSSILLEVDSPGGSPVASEEIMEAVNDSKKPVVVWISDVGASGAYLAVSPADKIIASPSSMVGSIGVLMDITDLSQYYQNLGINKYAIKAGEYKDMGADYRALTANETKMLQDMVDEDYDRFVTLVAENRHLDKDYVLSIAEGKIYTGTQAKNIKLIDDTGSEQDALDAAAQLGGIKGGYNVITITTTSALEDLINSFSSRLAYSMGRGIGSFMQNNTLNYGLS